MIYYSLCLTINKNYKKIYKNFNVLFIISVIYSLYQTYKDMGYYNDALHYCYKEYELIKDIPKEAYATLTNIAEMSFLAKKPYDQIEKACYDARNAVSIFLLYSFIYLLIIISIKLLH